MPTTLRIKLGDMAGLAQIKKNKRYILGRRSYIILKFCNVVWDMTSIRYKNVGHVGICRKKKTNKIQKATELRLDTFDYNAE